MKILVCGRVLCVTFGLLSAVALQGSLFLRTAEASGGPVTVTVLDDATGLPIANARVTVGESTDANANGILDAFPATTDAAGQCTVVLSAPQEFYDVYVAADAYDPYYREQAFVDPGPSVVAIHAARLKPNPKQHVIALSLVHPVTGVGTPGAIIAADPTSRRRLGLTSTGGVAYVSLPTGDTSDIAISSWGIALDQRFHNFRLATGQTSVTVASGEAGHLLLTGRLKDSSGADLTSPQLSVQLFTAARPESIVAAVASDNSFEIRGVPPGTYTAVCIGGKVAYAESIEITAQATSPLNITLSETAASVQGSIAGTVKDPHGTAMGDVPVTIMRSISGRLFDCGERVKAGSVDGAFSFNGLPYGNYILIAGQRSTSRGTVSSTIALSSGSQTVNLVLPDREGLEVADSTGWNTGSGSIAGQVRDLDGNPVSGATIALSRGRDPRVLKRITSDTSGNYTMPSLTDGEYAVSCFGGTQSAPMLQLDGDLMVTVSGGSAQTGKTLTLYSPHAIKVHVDSFTNGNTDILLVEGATVELRDSSDNVLATKTTGSNGDVTFSGLTLSTQYKVVASKTGLASTFRLVSLASSDAIIPGFSVVAVRFLLQTN